MENKKVAQELLKISKLLSAGYQDWGLRWSEFDRNDRIKTKQKFFKDEKARKKFIDKLEKKDNFKGVESYSDPKTAKVLSGAYKDDLEKIIDNRGLKSVIDTIAQICHDKAQHVRENQQDERRAKLWEKDAKHLERAHLKLENY